MKKRISFTLAMLLILGVCILPFATYASSDENECAESGHRLGPDSPEISSYYDRQRPLNESSHARQMYVVSSCPCGYREIIYPIDVYIEQGPHNEVSRVSAHSEGKHTVTLLCNICNYVHNQYSYVCPGNPCIYPEFRRDEMY